MYTDDDVEALLELAERLHPEPVDVFEDELAAKLGFYRGPGMSKAEWRRVRVELIEAATDDED